MDKWMDTQANRETDVDKKKAMHATQTHTLVNIRDTATDTHL